MSDAEKWARRFHETYESLAPDFGYETRTDTREFDPTTPNGQLMMAVCANVVTGAIIEARDAEVERIRSDNDQLTRLNAELDACIRRLGGAPMHLNAALRGEKP